MIGIKTDPWSDDLTAELAALLPDLPLEFHSFVGQPFLVAPWRRTLELLAVLQNQLSFDFLVDITAVDYPQREERFDLIYVLYSFPRNRRIRVHTSIADGDQPGSATSLYKTADWLEREIFDLFGIPFVGHPDLRRILMPDGWSGFPLRKDYSILLQDQDWVQKNLGIESGQ